MKKYPFALLAFALSINAAKSDELGANIASTTALVKIGKTVEVTKQKEQIFRDVICNFSVTSGQSSPHSLILAGKVVDNNAGAPREFVPIFFGSTLHFPRLAAFTNVKGEFSFRVWLSQKPDEKISNRLQAASIKKSTLYLHGGYNDKAEMVSSATHIYSLRDFENKVQKQKR